MLRGARRVSTSAMQAWGPTPFCLQVQSGWQDGPVLAAAVGSGEEGGLAAQRQGLNDAPEGCRSLARCAFVRKADHAIQRFKAKGTDFTSLPFWLIV